MVPRRALVAGAAGRLGEALLAAVVSSPRYRAVTVLTEGPLGSTIAGLEGASLAELERAPAGGTGSLELDVFVCWGDVNDPMGSSHNRRDAIYAQVSDAAALRAVAHAACGLRARRLLLLAPLLAWQQVSAASRMLPEAMEMELARLPIASIVIVRPTTERQRPLPAGAGRLQRFARFYLSQLRFMLPAATHPLRSTDIARATLSLMAEADRPGLSVVSLAEIRLRAETSTGTRGDKSGDKSGDRLPERVDKARYDGDKAGDKAVDKALDPGDKAMEPGDNPVEHPWDKAGDKAGDKPADNSRDLPEIPAAGDAVSASSRGQPG